MTWDWRGEAHCLKPTGLVLLWSITRHWTYEQRMTKWKEYFRDINFELISIVLTFLFWLLIKNTKLGRGSGLQGNLILTQRDILVTGGRGSEVGYLGNSRLERERWLKFRVTGRVSWLSKTLGQIYELCWDWFNCVFNTLQSSHYTLKMCLTLMGS